MTPTPAELETIDGRPVLRFERRLTHSPERVWKVVTEPEELAHWFPARVETELRAGAPMRFTFEDMDIDAPSGEVLEVDPPKLFTYLWGDDVLRFELVPDGTGCRLVFTHTLGEAGGGRLAAGRNAAGWDDCLAALSAMLDGRSAEGAQEKLYDRIESYVERFGLAEGEVHDDGDGYVVRFQRDLVWRPIEEVWTALVGDPASGDIAVGTQPPPTVTDGRVPAGPVTTLDPPHALEYSWQHDGVPAGSVHFEVSADPRSGTRLELTQTVGSKLADALPGVLAAWQTHLERFFSTLNRTTPGWPEDRPEKLETMYAGRLAQGGRASG